VSQLLTVSEFASELGISVQTVYAWRRRGKLPDIIKLPGGGIRVKRAALERILGGGA